MEIDWAGARPNPPNSDIQADTMLPTAVCFIGKRQRGQGSKESDSGLYLNCVCQGEP